ncbi:MAG: 4Fe-4S dicluster domain-containing protein [Planctomycetota bacterium]
MTRQDPPRPDARRLDRRAFLVATGFSFAGAVGAGCSRAPEKRAVAPAIQPVEYTPGRSYRVASTCAACSAGCGLLVECRDGRPVKLEGNPGHPLSRGGLCPVGQASILGLYDRQRLRGPRIAGAESTWKAVDAAIGERLAAIRANGQGIRLLTGTVTSPTTAAWIRRFLASFADARQVVFDPGSCSAILAAHSRTHGARVLPRYRFDKAELVVGIDADFLGTWISPVEFTAGYTAGRDPDLPGARFSRHVQFESRLSVTGAKADTRVIVAPSERRGVVGRLASRIAGLAGVDLSLKLPSLPQRLAAVVDELATQLWAHRGASLVVSGEEEVGAQALGNFVNHALGNYGRTLDVAHPSRQRAGDDAAVHALVEELTASAPGVGALFVHGANPVYALPGGERLAEALARLPLVVSFAPRIDETSRRAHFVCPEPHDLEAWGDVEAVAGIVSFLQPAIPPFGDTRTLAESLAAWMGEPRPMPELLPAQWPDRAFRERVLHDGYGEIERAPQAIGEFTVDAREADAPEAPAAGGLALVLYSTVGIRDEAHAGNPWLQELPDPITKMVWDNYACLSPAAAEGIGVAQGDVVRVEAVAGAGGETAVELPVLVQPGQHDGVVAVALGYGSEGTRRFADLGPEWLDKRPTVNAAGRVGASATPLLEFRAESLRRAGRAVRVVPTGETRELAGTQGHQSIAVPDGLAPAGAERRPLVQQTTLAALRAPGGDPALAAPPAHGELWPEDHEYPGHRWGMVIDLSRCTGCSACVIACQIENNVPVVGKDEVRRNREMHWLRVDRYYDERPGGGVDVLHQPMMCHHCERAPCETVCPLLATVHSEEGLNQQVYNRCVGTRYCANNCPYKVRRFNWFEYPWPDPLANLVLNPDVTVRSRGVMEKCSLCVQRIQEARIDAQARGAPLAEGDIQTACQQSCPAGAIAFGDRNDAGSRVSRLIRGARHYRVLEELGVRPAVGYLAVVRNR